MTAQPPKDQLYARPLAAIEGFVFDDQVADVFPDMILRSVPGYASIINNIGTLARQYAQEQSHVYDLGCSLGAASLSICSRLKNFSGKIIAVDNSAAMTQRCCANMQSMDNGIEVEVICDDIENIEITNASVVIINFTLQFIKPELRASLLNNIFRGMLKNSCLILSEKIVFADAGEQRFYDEQHQAFKKTNGYSDLEISQKRSALENVLISDTLETHYQRLREAGFSEIHNWFRCYNFASLIAIKQ